MTGGTGVPAPMVVAATRHWIDTIVVGLGLCPFARPVLDRDLARIVVLPTTETAEVLQRVGDEGAALLDGDARDATTLLVVPEGFGDFDAYLDLVAVAEALLVDLGHEGELQIASFHPDYLFAGESAGDAANCTNRAPYPMLQLLQEESVERALDRHPDPAAIPVRNMERMRALGAGGIRALLAPRTDATRIH